MSAQAGCAFDDRDAIEPAGEGGGGFQPNGFTGENRKSALRNVFGHGFIADTLSGDP